MLWGVGLFLLTFTASLAIVAVLIVLLPANYFVDRRPFLARQPPLVRAVALVVKNLLGMALVGLGIALSIPGVPGQGLLTVLIGLALVDIPGKRRLMRLIARRPLVQRSMNGLRARFGREPMIFEQPAT
jgi:hypothetical protein